MQVAKNLFLWPGHSYIRKAFEIPLALVLDFVWPKRRILEIYLTSPNGATMAFSAPRRRPTPISMNRLPI